MALRFLDSYDHYTDIAQKYVLGHSNDSISSGGRFGNCLQASFRNAGPTLLVDAQSTWIVGFAWKYSSPTLTAPVMLFNDAGTNQSGLWIDSATGLLQAYRNNGTTFLGAGTIPIALNTWTYIEVKITIHNSTGVFVTRVNETTDINLSSIDTQQTANATSNQFQIVQGGSGNWAWWLDDLYICDGTGGVNDDFLGDVRIQAIFPNGNGNSSQLVGSDANSTDNYLLVDETVPSTSDYVESSTPTDKDTYTYGNVTPTTGTVYGVQILPYAAKTDAGVRSIQAVARHSGTEEDTGTDMILSTSAQYFVDTRDTKPGGGSWSISDVNAAEFGVKVTA